MITINQTQVFTSTLASTFSITSSTRVFSFYLWVLKNSSSQPWRVLKFRVNTSWPWHPGVSLLSGPKYSSYHLCRLQGQIGWHALTLNRVLAPCVCRSTFASTGAMSLCKALWVFVRSHPRPSSVFKVKSPVPCNRWRQRLVFKRSRAPDAVQVHTGRVRCELGHVRCAWLLPSEG